MIKDKIIAPSILSADFTNLSQQIRSAELGGADWIHCDVMDGKFVPNLTFGPLVVKAVKKTTRLPIDVHLMIQNPNNLIQDFVDAGANRITIHQEEVIHLERMLNHIHDHGIKAGVAINPSTPVSFLSEVIHLLDLVLVMSVNPGFGGQTFIYNSIKKINQLAELREKHKLNFLIEVDGGINTSNVKEISEAGCNVFVIGSSIFGTDNITAATVEFKNAVS